MHSRETWLKCRRDYVAGKGFLPDMARKYGLPVATVQTRAKREKWSTARAEFISRKLKSPDLELPPAPPAPLPDANNLTRKLARLELQVERLDGMLDSECDPDALNKLATAKARLMEQWRIFSGIPLPGSRRPAREKPKREVVSTGPLDD